MLDPTGNGGACGSNHCLQHDRRRSGGRRRPDARRRRCVRRAFGGCALHALPSMLTGRGLGVGPSQPPQTPQLLGCTGTVDLSPPWPARHRTSPCHTTGRRWRRRRRRQPTQLGAVTSARGRMQWRSAGWPRSRASVCRGGPLRRVGVAIHPSRRRPWSCGRRLATAPASAGPRPRSATPPTRPLP